MKILIIIGVMLAVGGGALFRMKNQEADSQKNLAVQAADSQNEGRADPEDTIHCRTTFDLSNGGVLMTEHAISSEAEYERFPMMGATGGTSHILTRYAEAKRYNWVTGLPPKEGQDSSKSLFFQPNTEDIPSESKNWYKYDNWQLQESIKNAKTVSLDAIALSLIARLSVPKGATITPRGRTCEPVKDMSIFSVPRDINFQTAESLRESWRR